MKSQLENRFPQSKIPPNLRTRCKTTATIPIQVVSKFQQTLTPKYTEAAVQVEYERCVAGINCPTPRRVSICTPVNDQDVFLFNTPESAPLASSAPPISGRTSEQRIPPVEDNNADMSILLAAKDAEIEYYKNIARKMQKRMTAQKQKKKNAEMKETHRIESIGTLLPRHRGKNYGEHWAELEKLRLKIENFKRHRDRDSLEDSSLFSEQL